MFKVEDFEANYIYLFLKYNFFKFKLYFNYI